MIEVYEEDADPNSYKYLYTRTLIFDHIRVYKNKSIDKMIVSLLLTRFFVCFLSLIYFLFLIQFMPFTNYTRTM